LKALLPGRKKIDWLLRGNNVLTKTHEQKMKNEQKIFEFWLKLGAGACRGWSVL